MDIAYRGALERFTRSVSTIANLPPAIPGVGEEQIARPHSGIPGHRPQGKRRTGLNRNFHRRLIYSRQKRGLCVGPTKRGKGTKIMAIVDRAGLPISVCIESASPHEVTLVETTLDQRFVAEQPLRLIGDKAYDSDPLDQRLLDQHGIELIAPHKRNRKKKPTQDGRPLRRYRRRWEVERLFAWFHNYRRLTVRWEFHAANFLGFLKLGCMMILLSHF